MNSSTTFLLGMALVIIVLVIAVAVTPDPRDLSAKTACQAQGFSSGHYDATYGFVCEQWQPIPTPVWKK